MKIICKDETAECPEGLRICCGICEKKSTCIHSCMDCENHQDCPSAVAVSEEVVQFVSAVPDTIKSITSLMKMKKELEDREKQLKENLVKAMESHGVKSFENDVIKMVYVAPTTRKTIDSTKLKQDHPDIAKQYTKTSEVSASVRVTVKGSDK